MKILLVSSAFYPEISPRSFRATELAKEYVRQGNQVVVISKFRDHDYTEFLGKYPLTLNMWNRPRFPKVPRLKTYPFSLFFKAIERLLALLFEYPAMEEMFQVKRMLRTEEGYDLMISFAVPFPVHWGVAKARSAKHPIARKWVADCGDAYMFARLDAYRKPFYFKYLEKGFSRKCDYITIPFKDLEVQFYPQFLSKIKVIPQGFNFEEIKLYEGERESAKPVFTFAGSVIPGKRDLSLFLEFLTSLDKDFEFHVYTNQAGWYQPYKEALGEKLQLHDYIDRLTLIYEMSKADFLINVDTIYDSQEKIEAVPSKLIDYALSGRPILNLNSAHLDRDLVREFLNGNFKGQRVIKKSDYDIKRVSEKFLKLLSLA